ncbi:MAG: class I SAM-dependent methyltransferase [Armatimonadetes bacterium]|nr:class I SAM-dependent methyltransferase [Armatimonadota bacterium]
MLRRHPPGLRPYPKPQFFMSLGDIRFWIDSAHTDSALARLRAEHGTADGIDALYRERPDPWGATRTCYRYQRLKYERLTAFIPARRYERVLDLGCGIGAFTRHLAPHVGAITGVELSASGVQQARDLSVDHANADYRQGDVLHVGDAVGQSTYDLVILADVLYYLSPLSAEVLDGVCASVAAAMEPGGVLLLANHCVGTPDAESRQTRFIHSRFRQSSAFRVLREAWRPFYLATILERVEE